VIQDFSRLESNIQIFVKISACHTISVDLHTANSVELGSWLWAQLEGCIKLTPTSYMVT
jgi:hypothetical protein